MELLNAGVAGVAVITVICYLIGMWVKISGIDDRYIPLICGLAGAALGVAALLTGVPDFPAEDLMTAAAVGIASGLAATGADQLYKQINKE